MNHQDILKNTNFYLDKDLPNYLNIEYLIISHQGVVNPLTSKTTTILMEKPRNLTKRAKAIIEFASKHHITILSLHEFSGFFTLCPECRKQQTEKKDSKQPNIKEEKTQGGHFKYILMIENSLGNILPKVYTALSEVPTIDFDSKPGICAIQTTHTNESKNQPYYCECCEQEYLNLEKHIITDEHLKFRNNDDNYKEIDDIFNELRKEKIINENNFNEKQKATLFDSIVNIDDLELNEISQDNTKKYIQIKKEYMDPDSDSFPFLSNYKDISEITGGFQESSTNNIEENKDKYLDHIEYLKEELKKLCLNKIKEDLKKKEKIDLKKNEIEKLSESKLREYSKKYDFEPANSVQIENLLLKLSKYFLGCGDSQEEINYPITSSDQERLRVLYREIKIYWEPAHSVEYLLEYFDKLLYRELRDNKRIEEPEKDEKQKKKEKKVKGVEKNLEETPVKKLKKDTDEFQFPVISRKNRNKVSPKSEGDRKKISPQKTDPNQTNLMGYLTKKFI